MTRMSNYDPEHTMNRLQHQMSQVNGGYHSNTNSIYYGPRPNARRGIRPNTMVHTWFNRLQGPHHGSVQGSHGPSIISYSSSALRNENSDQIQISNRHASNRIAMANQSIAQLNAAKKKLEESSHMLSSNQEALARAQSNANAASEAAIEARLQSLMLKLREVAKQYLLVKKALALVTSGQKTYRNIVAAKSGANLKIFF